MYRYTHFDTALGRCAIAWGPAGIVAVELPGRDDAATLRRIRRARPDAVTGDPPPDVAAAIERIAGVLAGASDDLVGVRVDLSGVPEFNRRVYAAARAIPPGSTRSYGELADAIGERGGAQAVGQALGRNPVPIVVPCHRVLAADGSLRGFSAPGGLDTKRRMLELEGAAAPALF